MIPDYASVFGLREGFVVKTLIEERPKWMILLLTLRKSGMMSVTEARRTLKLSYKTLKTAVLYLGGVSLGRSGNSQPSPHAVTPLGIGPVVTVIKVPGNKKFVALTDYGMQFANRVVNFLKDVALRLGSVNVESEYGVPKVSLLSELSSRFPRANPEVLLTRFVSFENLVAALTRTRPSLLAVMRPELIDAVPVELEIAVDRRTTKRLLLYLVL